MDMNDPDMAAMAAAMGFSSFGAQDNPSKRRKFNPSADAVVAGSATSTLPHHPTQPAGQASASGSNTAPLGTRATNKDEIDLDLEDDEDEPSTPAQPSQPSEEAPPQYIDTSRPSTDPELSLQGTAAMLQSSQHPSLPPRPNPPQFQPRGAAKGPERRQARDNGKPWWEDYYDPSSNVNPWERLEQNMGLQPTEKWMTWEEAKA